MPDVRDVAVAGGANRPGISEPVDGEVCLDIEVVGGAAPGARLVCYFGQTTGQGFIQTVHAAIHDRVNRPSVISLSWDLSEGFWMATPGMVDLMEDVLVDAALLGITVVCSAGDYGTPTTFHDGEAWVDYPASSPHVIACGGTTLSSLGASIVAETVWNTSADMGQTTGGGISRLFPVPPWQEHVALPRSLNAGASPGRGVPDVAANADPRTGYLVQVTGAGTKIICGTSSAAPLWAALIARINQRLGTRVGYINPLLYAAGGTGAFRDVVAGDNTFYYGYVEEAGAGKPGEVLGIQTASLAVPAGRPASPLPAHRRRGSRRPRGVHARQATRGTNAFITGTVPRVDPADEDTEPPMRSGLMSSAPRPRSRDSWG